jgi:hypothetical protein
MYIEGCADSAYLGTYVDSDRSLRHQSGFLCGSSINGTTLTPPSTISHDTRVAP